MKKRIIDIIKLIIVYIILTVYGYYNSGSKYPNDKSWLEALVIVIIVYPIILLLERKNKKQMSERKALKIFKDYLTGVMSTEDFWERYTTDEKLRNALINDRKRNKRYKYVNPENGKVLYVKENDAKFRINPDTLLTTIHIDRLQDRYELYSVINKYLLERGIYLKIAEANADLKEFINLRKMLPKWAGVEDVSYLQKILAEAPQNLNYSRKLKWGKYKIRDLFRCVNNKPVWIKQPEWPTRDDKPLLFVDQKKAEEGFEQYFFFDVKRQEEVVIEQRG